MSASALVQTSRFEGNLTGELNMAVKLQPLHDYVAVEQEKPGELRTKSGLYVAGVSKEEKIAKVISVGKEVKNLKIGDRVIYKSYSTNEVELEYGGTKYLLVKEEDILATVDDGIKKTNKISEKRGKKGKGNR